MSRYLRCVERGGVMAEVWTVTTSEDGKRAEVRDENGLLVADLGTQLDAARLIAKAPQLHAMLARLLTTAGYRLEETSLLQQLHDEARALLAEIDQPAPAGEEQS